MRTELPSWKRLSVLATELKDQSISDLFERDSNRFTDYSITFPDVLFDYSKNNINQHVKTALADLINETQVLLFRDDLVSGNKVNVTEQRAVLHTALRANPEKPIYVDNHNVQADIASEHVHIKHFVEGVRSGKLTGTTNKAFTDVVSIGVGGSHLGPEMVTQALASYSKSDLNVHYVSNVDAVQLTQVLSTLNVETTLFVISSKTFSTIETLTNANTARDWFKAALLARNIQNITAVEQGVAKHFIAVSANKDKAVAFGIRADNIFNMWDWVGGRFSLWSAIGLPIALSIGFEHFKALLAGANEIDEHFVSAPVDKNIPMMMAAISVWNTTFLGASAQAILPYDQCLHMLPSYLQQAEMESNGKSVDWHGKAVDYATVPLIWGGTGINGQHAYYQFLHQGTQVVPADFIGSIHSQVENKTHHDVLMANFFAQSHALMAGVNKQQVKEALTDEGMSTEQIEGLAPHKVHQGNRPSNTILLDRINPRNLGKLIALYEHKIFVQGVILGIYSFDQWGVELGKKLANSVLDQIQRNQAVNDSLLGYFLKHKHAE